MKTRHGSTYLWSQHLWDRGRGSALSFRPVRTTAWIPKKPDLKKEKCRKKKASHQIYTLLQINYTWMISKIMKILSQNRHFFYFFEMGFLCVALWTRLDLNSQTSTHLCLPRVRIKALEITIYLLWYLTIDIKRSSTRRDNPLIMIPNYYVFLPSTKRLVLC